MAFDPKTQALINKYNKDFGAETVVYGQDRPEPPRFTSGSLSIDVALGGGFPANQWVEILGHESAAKTTLVLKAIAANQELDPNFTVFWLEAETYNESFAAILGVDNSRVIRLPTNKMEDAYEALVEWSASRAVDWVVLDSYPALIPDDEAGKGIYETTVALGARITSKFFRKVVPASKRNRNEPDRPFLGVFINQWRDKIAAGWQPMGAATESSPGGNSKNYVFYVRLNVAPAGQIKEDRKLQEGTALKVNVGQTIKAVTVKNKSAPPKQIGSVDFYFRDAPQKGFSAGEYDTAKEAVTMGLVYRVIVKENSKTYSYRGQKFNGMPDLLGRMRESLELQAQIREDVLEAIKIPENEGLLGEAQNDD